MMDLVRKAINAAVSEEKQNRIQQEQEIQKLRVKMIAGFRNLLGLKDEVITTVAVPPYGTKVEVEGLVFRLTYNNRVVVEYECECPACGNVDYYEIKNLAALGRRLQDTRCSKCKGMGANNVQQS